MASVRPSDTPAGGRSPAATGSTTHRRPAAQQHAETRCRGAERRRAVLWGSAALILLLVAGVGYVAARGDGPGDTASGSPLVGGDLHTVATIGDAVYVTGHEAAAVSRDGGAVWHGIDSLIGADVMGWAITPAAVMVGGHPGLYRSTDRGLTFTKVDAPVQDVHALGAAARTVYLASPNAGLLASTDGGQSWQTRNPQASRSFMGTLLVDPADPARIIAPDMTNGVVASTDGGKTFTSLGGPVGVMAVAWSPTDNRQVVAVGTNGGARSGDGGATWQPLQVPAATSAIAYDTTGTTLYAAALDGTRARLSSSTDNGTTWKRTA